MNDLPAKAARFAIAAHGDQKYGSRPYEVHLRAVAGHLEPFGPEAMAIGFLHDVVEDTGVPLEEVREEFGDLVADCVALVTDEPGEDRKERKKKTYAKMARVRGPLELALVVKAADRLANLEACLADGRAHRFGKYVGEHAAFRAAAYRPGLCDDLWRRIEAAIAAEPQEPGGRTGEGGFGREPRR